MISAAAQGAGDDILDGAPALSGIQPSGGSAAAGAYGYFEVDGVWSRQSLSSFGVLDMTPASLSSLGVS
jgi:hypothetical protein